jgi:small-conductance mechanosensitive channel
MLAAPVNDACGVDPSSICRRVFDWSDSATTAETVDWLTHKPLRLALIIVASMILARIVRRSIDRLVQRLVRERTEAARAQAERHSLGTSWGVQRLTERTERARQRAITFGGVLRGVAQAAIFAIATLTCLSEVGINLGPLIAGAGIAGLAIGFGAQSLVRDVIAGAFVVLEDQYGVGDTVDIGEAKGVIERVNLRTTQLRDIEGTLWTVPNGEIKRVANKSQLWARAVLDIRIAYDADLDRAQNEIKRVADDLWQKQLDGLHILEEPSVLGVEAFADGATVVRLSLKTDPGAQFRLAREVRGRLKTAFDAAGIRGLGAMNLPPTLTPAFPPDPEAAD